MIEMLYVLLLEIFLLICMGCRYVPADDDDHHLAIELARVSDKIDHNLGIALMVPGPIEDIYHAHALLLCKAALVAATPFATTVRGIIGNDLQTLLGQTLPEIKELCSDQNMQQIFKKIYQQVQQKVPFDNRMQLWVTLLRKCDQMQRSMRTDYLSSIWFPKDAHISNEKNFMIKNAHLILNKTQKKYLMVDTVITFLPFALMAQYDAEVFNRFVRVRQGTDHL